MNSTYRNRDISEQVRAIHSGEITISELSSAVRTDITRYEDRLKAWVALADMSVPFPPSSPEVDDSAGARPLEGVSIGVKDIIDVAGLPTRSGSAVTSALSAEADAACVARFRELGAVIQGKTVTTEFGYFSPGLTVNPWDHECTPGGSSSGSAAAVGANTIALALGTQTAGSLTRPASFCGAAGMVLAAGSTPMAGVNGMSETLDSLGMITRTVADLAYVYSAFAGQDVDRPEDSAASGMKLHIWHGSEVLPLAPQMQDLLREVPRIAADIGVDHKDLDWNDHVVTLTADHRTVMGYEAARTLAGVQAEHEAELSPQLLELLRGGAEIQDQDYREALIRRDISRRALERLLGPDGVIIGPAAQGPALNRCNGTGSPDLSRAWQLLGLPVVVVPGARSTTGMPLGLQLIGLPGSEQRLLTLGQLLEKRLRRLPSFSEHTSQPTLKDLTW
ncbi:amidase [Corynebacterium comes]|uniref:Glutamyl-tRNA(Gln) amidotransferase subunit A n=1 Tax=Corynebacterium comes TaxID=2675218 RepID=A0A6B8VV02_9CORY|nr:amidase [Corynebacterium comes]QGU05174.1 Glutamyl-tRNA(Gln) amidotransferase subunit A [Corynebacterium comes]